MKKFNIGDKVKVFSYGLSIEGVIIHYVVTCEPPLEQNQVLYEVSIINSYGEYVGLGISDVTEPELQLVTNSKENKENKEVKTAVFFTSEEEVSSFFYDMKVCGDNDFLISVMANSVEEAISKFNKANVEDPDSYQFVVFDDEIYELENSIKLKG